MAVVHEQDDTGSNAAVVAIFLIGMIVILAILFYGFAVAHWFGVGHTTIINPATSTAPSIAASTSASTSASP